MGMLTISNEATAAIVIGTLIFIVYMYILAIKERSSFNSIGFREFKPNFKRIFTIALIFIIGSSLVLIIGNAKIITPNNFAIPFRITSFIILAVSLELMTRGYLLHRLKDKNKVLSIIYSIGMYIIVYSCCGFINSYLDFISILLLNIIMTILVLKYDSVYISIFPFIIYYIFKGLITFKVVGNEGMFYIEENTFIIYQIMNIIVLLVGLGASIYISLKSKD